MTESNFILPPRPEPVAQEIEAIDCELETCNDSDRLIELYSRRHDLCGRTVGEIDNRV